MCCASTSQARVSLEQDTIWILYLRLQSVLGWLCIHLMTHLWEIHGSNFAQSKMYEAWMLLPLFAWPDPFKIAIQFSSETSLWVVFTFLQEKHYFEGNEKPKRFIGVLSAFVIHLQINKMFKVASFGPFTFFVHVLKYAKSVRVMVKIRRIIKVIESLEFCNFHSREMWRINALLGFQFPNATIANHIPRRLE